MVDEYQEARETSYDNPSWKDYGPPILGAIIVLLILVGGWQLWRNRTQEPQQNAQVVQEEQTGAEEEAATPTPSPIPTTTNTEGGQVGQLPETGFPLPVAAGASLLSVLAGWRLRKKFQ